MDQYFRDEDLTDEIIAAYKVRRDAGRKIPPLIVISNDWETGLFMSPHAGHDTDLINKFRDAQIPIIYCKMVTKEAADRKDIYIHAKVLVVDDVFYTIGSANYNDRSMRSDPELNIGTVDPQGAESLRRDLWNICIGSPVNEIMDNPRTGTDSWEDKLAQNALEAEANANLTYGRSIIFNPTYIKIFPSKLAENTQHENDTSYA